MEFRLDEAQVDLQETVARFCADSFPLDALAEREGVAVDPRAWRELADLEFSACCSPRTRAASASRQSTPPSSSSNSGATSRPDRCSGPSSRRHSSRVRSPGEQRVGGVDVREIVDRSVVVEHAAEIDVLLVISDDGVFAHRMADLPPSSPLVPLDPLTPLGRITGLGSGEQIGSSAHVEELRTLGTLLSAAMAAGISTRVDVARAYALERQQFGAPIGSFQAVKHILADMYVRSVSGQSAMYAASAVVHEPGGRRRHPCRCERQAPRCRRGGRECELRGPGVGRHGLHVGHVAQLPAETRGGCWRISSG